MAILSIAQATTVQAPAGTVMGGGETLEAQTTKLEMTTKLANENPGPTFTCTHSVLSGPLTNNKGGEHAGGEFTSATATGCKSNALVAHVTTNASAKNPWALQIEQPNAGLEARTTVGGVINVTAQVQFFGSVATCEFATTSMVGTLQDSGVAHFESVFTLVKGPEAMCGVSGLLKAAYTFTHAGKAIQVDMT